MTREWNPTAREQDVEALRAATPPAEASLQEHLAYLVAADPHDIDRLTRPPWDAEPKGKAKEGDAVEGSNDLNAWIYESLRWVSFVRFL
jgi:hypothetical protein